MDSNDHGGGDLAVNLDERNTDYDELETSGSLQYLDDCEKPIRFTDKKGSDKLPVGVLGICVKGCHINEYDVNSQCCYLITIKVQQLESSTTSTRVHTEFYASWNEVKHLPVTIYPKCSDVRNTIDFCLATVDRNKDAATVIGLAALRLHDIVKSRCLSTLLDIKTLPENKVVGELELEICMSYGVFGFGHSTQLVFKGCTPESYLRHSLLPYIQTPKGQRRDSSGLLLPKRMAHPSFIPFRLPAFLANSQEPSQMVNMTSSTGFKSSIDSSSVGTNESSAGVPHLVQNMRRLTAMRSLLDGIDCRHQRVKCLRDIVTGRAEEEIALISLPQEVRRPSTAPSTTYTNTDVEVQLGDETLSLFKWNKQRTSSLQQASGTDLTPSWSTDFSSQTKTSNFPRVTFAEDDTEFPLINQWNRRQTIDSINSVQPLPQHLLFPRGSLQPVNNHDFFFAPRFSKLHTESVRSKTSWLTSRHLSQPKRDI